MNLKGLGYSLLTTVLICFAVKLNAQVTVDDDKTAAQLAQKLAGQGIQVMNAVLTCPAVANGTFTVTSGNLGLDSGVILTSGRAASQGSAKGVNGGENALASNNNNTSGDLQLTQLAGQTTHDACVLEFDLVPKGDTIKFNYVFSSEEYVNSTCGPYNDAFAFFISGPGITGQQNMALVPGTNIPVTINSINSGIPGPNGNIANCYAMGPGSPFTSYFVNNAGGATITHNGFTQVLKAQHAVYACNTYHLKIAIADAGNGLYDSGVFLEAGSLKANTPNVIATSTATTTVSDTPYFVKGCSAGGFTISRQAPSPLPQTIHFAIGGSAANGIDYAAIPDSVVIPANGTSQQINIAALATAPHGPKTITLFILSSAVCGAQVVDSATLLMYDTMRVNINTLDTLICGFQPLQLSIDAFGPYNFVWTPAASLNNANIQNPIATPFDTTRYVLNASWPGSGCQPLSDSVLISVLPVPAINAGNDFNTCTNTPIFLTLDVNPYDPIYTYSWTGPNGFTSTDQNTGVPAEQVTTSGAYVVAVDVHNGCPPLLDSTVVQAIPPPPAPVLPSYFSMCKATVLSHRNELGEGLLWYNSPTDTNASFVMPLDDSSAEGVYTFYVALQDIGCPGPRVKIDVSIRKCCEDYIYVPTAFTPNNDGKNDLFRVSKGEDHTVTEFRVYDRWGDAVFESYGADAAWDGTFNGKPLDAADYYYYMVIHCRAGTDIYKKGPVTLIR